MEPRDFHDLEELTDEHLGFSALSDGLGFSKSKEKNSAGKAEFKTDSIAPMPSGLKAYSAYGSGAIAAGVPRFAPAVTRKSKAETVQSPISAPAAHWILRSVAFILDLSFLLLPFTVAWSVSFGHASAQMFRQNPLTPLILFLPFLATYFLLSESFGGQSLGKMCLGLRVVEDDRYEKPIGLRLAFLRILLFSMSTAFFGLGLLALFFDKKKRPWQDRFSGSIVRKSA